MAEFIDLTGSDDEKPIPKPRPNHGRSCTSSSRADENPHIPPSQQLSAPSLTVQSSGSTVQTTRSHIPVTIAPNPTRSRGSQEPVRSTTPSLRPLAPNLTKSRGSQEPARSTPSSLRPLAPKRKSSDDGAGEALHGRGQSVAGGLKRNHSSYANDASAQNPPGISGAGTASSRLYPLFSITPQKRRPSDEERPLNSRTSRTPSKIDSSRRLSVGRTPPKTTSRDITTYLRPQASTSSVGTRGQNSIGNGTDTAIKSSSRTVSKLEGYTSVHVSAIQSKMTPEPSLAIEDRKEFARNLTQSLIISSLAILKGSEVKTSGFLEVGKLKKLHKEFTEKVERAVTEKVEEYVLGEGRRTAELTEEEISAATQILGRELREETQTLRDQYLELVESRCTPSQDKPPLPPPNQTRDRLRDNEMQGSSNHSNYVPSPSLRTQSDESLPDNDVQDPSNFSVRATSMGVSDGASSSSDPQHPRSNHDKVKNLKVEHHKERTKRRRTERTPQPARVRPSRTAGKSALTLISSLYENPFGYTESNTPQSSQSQHGSVIANAAFANSRTGEAPTPLTAGSSTISERPRLSPQTRSVSYGSVLSLSAALAVASLEAEHKPVPEVVLEEDMQEELVETSRFLLPGNASTPVLKPHPRSNILDSSIETPRRMSSAFTMLESDIKDPIHRSTSQVASLLRRREIGSSSCGPIVQPMDALPTKLTEYLKPWRSWRGASNDVVAVAWAPDSVRFAAGAAAHSNDEDLHYNRPCNFLYGNLQKNVLHELPDHSIDRKRPEQILSGPSANPMVYQSCDPKVYMTVTSVKFSPFTNHMYSASEDQTVRIWDLDSLECRSTTQHEAFVTCLDVSPSCPGLFAAGSKTLHHSVHVYGTSKSGLAESGLSLSSSRAESRQHWTLYPECLQWGQTPSTEHLLLGGFLQWGREEIGMREGHLCLWDTIANKDLKVLPGSQAVHAASWHPSMPYFAAGVSRGLTFTNRLETKTVVRIWDLRGLKRNIVEYECPAEEITDVTFHPMDSNIATAGCTNGISYVWDFRWKEKPLHILQHGKSVMLREEKNTGVMMSIWGKGSSLYYTGSSDGNVLAWDIRRHPVDALVQNVAHVGAGISSGSLSPDGTHLLVGDVSGGIHVLSSVPWAPRPENDNDPACEGYPMTIVRASRDYSNSQIQDAADSNPGTVGIEAARELLVSGSVVIHPDFGPGKGPNYSGPYAKSERKTGDGHGPAEGVGHLQKHVYRKQVFSRKGELREINAKPLRDLSAARREMLDHPSENCEDYHSPGAIVEALEAEHTKNLTPRQQPSDEVLDQEDWDDDVTDSDGSSEDGEGWWPRLGEDEIALARARPRSSLLFDQDGPENFIPERRRRPFKPVSSDHL